MARASSCRARATVSRAPRMASVQIALDIQLSPVLHVVEFALSLAIDAQGIALLLDMRDDDADGFVNLRYIVELRADDLLEVAAQVACERLGAHRVKRAAQDDVDAAG